MLGAGGMGEVYRACDTRLECTVAIKIILAWREIGGTQIPNCGWLAGTAEHKSHT